MKKYFTSAMRFFLFVLGILIIDTKILANEVNRIYRSADFLGRGHAGIANPNQEDSLFYNPSNLYGKSDTTTTTEENQTDQSTRTEPGAKDDFFKKAVILSPLFTLSQNASQLTSAGSDSSKTLEALRDLVGKPVHAGFDSFSGVILKNMAIGAVLSGNVNLYVYKDANNSGVEAVKIDGSQNQVLSFGYADRVISDNLQIGGTIKYLNRTQISADVSIADIQAIKDFNLTNFQNQGSGLGADLGTTYITNWKWNPKFALTIMDIGDTQLNFAKDKTVNGDPIRQTINIGVAAKPDTTHFDSELFFDIRDLEGRDEPVGWKRVHLGASIRRWQLGLNLGINQGFGTMGLFYEAKLLRIDIGSYGEEVGQRVGYRPSARYFFRLASSF